MRIAYLCTKHPPMDRRVYHKISKALKKNGHSVINIHPNVQNIITEDGIQLLGYPQKPGWLGRIQSFKNARLAALQAKADIIIAAEPDSLYVALCIKRSIKKTKSIFDCHEWYGEHFNIRLKSGLYKKIVRTAITFLINRMVKKCAAVISVNETMSQYYAKHNLCSYAIPSIEDMAPSLDLSVSRSSFVFFGTFCGSAQEDILLGAAKRLKEQNISARIIVIGGSEDPRSFRQRIAETDLGESISILSWLPREQALLKLNEGCAGITRLDMKGFGLPALPNKLFEYMAAGMAVIGSSLNPEIAKIISEEKCGLSVPDETPEALAEAIRYLHENPAICRQMGQNSLRAVQKTYNWTHYGKLLEEIILKVAHKDDQAANILL